MKNFDYYLKVFLVGLLAAAFVIFAVIFIQAQVRDYHLQNQQNQELKTIVQGWKDLQCSVEVTQFTPYFSQEGGNGGFSVSTRGGCVWVAESNVDWVRITRIDGNGMNYDVKPNTSPGSRIVTITVGNKTVTVIQSSKPYKSKS